MATPNGHICVHGHFYQPPRENPWLGEVEREDSAAPYHDWNERITEECYGPVALGERVGSDGRVIAAERLLRRVSFDFGPTLLDWLERHRPSVYLAVLEADRATAASDELGNAVGHPYFHVILPLAPRRDKETLVRWGLADFRARFGRDARGFWLPETAVDDETLDVLASEGVVFTILDPVQAAATRPVGGEWSDADPRMLDPRVPYQWISPQDPSRRLTVFFYHRILSQAVVSGEAFVDPAAFAEAVKRRFLEGDATQLVHVASDGEFYGHHHKGAQRTLSLALDVLEADGVPATNLSRFLDLFPPPREVRVRPRTAWSCEHGLGRWERDCGCRSPHLPDWKQDWRGPLREALERLAQRLDIFYEDDAGRFFADPWAMRDKAAELWRITDAAARRRFLQMRAKRELSDEDEVRVLRLLALQRERLAMFTSCGWFFDDVSGVETVQVLARAARACDLARELGEDVEAAFLERLAAAKSNVKAFGDGAGVYRRLVAPTRAGLDRAAAHAAILDHVGLIPPRWPAALRVELGPAFRTEKSGVAGHPRSLSARAVRVERPETRERGQWHVIVHRGDALDFACWFAAPGSAAAEPLALGDEFLRLSDNELRSALDERYGASRFGLDAVFSDERAELARALAPTGGLGPERARFLSRWTATVAAARAGGRDDDAVLQLLADAREHAFLPEELPWARTLEEMLHERLEELLAEGGAARVSRALRWIDALQGHGLIRGAWRLRDFSRRWREKLDMAGPSAEADACRALGERLGIAPARLTEARW